MILLNLLLLLAGGAAGLGSRPSLPREVAFFFPFRPGPKSVLDRLLQFLPSGVVHLPLAMLRHLVWVPKGDAPVQEQPQPGFHGMRAGFHHHKITLLGWTSVRPAS